MALVPYVSPMDMKELRRKQYEDTQLELSRQFCFVHPNVYNVINEVHMKFAETRAKLETITWYVPRILIIHRPQLRLLDGIRWWHDNQKSKPGPRRELFM